MMANEGIEDMVEIDELNPATLLFNLANRYARYDIYCYVGPILLACNPFKPVPNLSSNELKAACMEIRSDPSPLQLKKNL
jgi:myosin heavy subunit